MNSQVLKESIEGFYRDYTNSNLPKGLSLAMPYGQESIHSQFLIRRSDNRYDVRNDRGPAGFDAEFQRGNTDLAVEEVALRRYTAPYEIIPESIQRSVAEQVSLAEPVVNGQLDYLFGQYINNLATAAGTLSSGTALDLSGFTADVAGSLKADIRTVQKACGKRPNVIYMGPDALDRFMLQDSVFAGGALAAAASPTVERRTGAVDEEAIRAWFRRVLGLELLVEDHVGIGTGGSADFLLSDTAVLAFAAGGSADSCFKTFHQDFGGGLASFEVNETVRPQPRGEIITAEAIYQVKVVNPAMGLKIDLTLS